MLRVRVVSAAAKVNKAGMQAAGDFGLRERVPATLLGYGYAFWGSYGSVLRYKSIERLKPIGKDSLLGASGEISDFQEILRYLDELMRSPTNFP
ncbi:probable proteasome subunit beta type-7 isoform X1 [Arachis hypogaea]|uniref:probable proteasome subunit beta type-7 isoform X1 n=1 Tax=Arachis hypogaea TaxID=3818 RepID=UPI003B21DD18